MRPILTLWLLVSTLWTPPLIAQAAPSLQARILLVEDRRAREPSDLALLASGLVHPDAAVIAAALRAMGRLEHPALQSRMTPLLAHREPAIRSRAAEALAQAAQGFRGDSSLERRGHPWTELLAALRRAAAAERDPAVQGMLGLSLGRLPYATAEEIVAAREDLLRLSTAAESNPDAARDVTRGLEMLVRATWRRVSLEPGLVARLNQLAGSGTGSDIGRHALGALLAAQRADPAVVTAALGSTDNEVRRLGATGISGLPAGPQRDAVFSLALTDREPAVRLEAARGWARAMGAAACGRLPGLAMDSSAAVGLVVLDLLANCGRDSLARNTVRTALRDSSTGWRRPAHALVSLARLAPDEAHRAILSAMTDLVWQTRMYAAKAATLLRDPSSLRRLAADSVANVREAALAGLREIGGNGFDSIYRANLVSKDYQLVITAAGALKGSLQHIEAVPALQAALARITAEHRETSRDARVALLTRLHELGTTTSAPALSPWLHDFDPVVAESAAVTISEWTGVPRRAMPARTLSASAPVTAPEIAALSGAVLRVTMAGGGVFEVELFTGSAPLTAARVARLTRQGYYNGLTFHRVVPNFVIQGGSPGANEYMGNGPFMPDELTGVSHRRGTLGISTRGRDTGDAQLFVNLVDNPRLDYEYTVFGRVISGMTVVDGILEGDVIRRAEIRPR